jgi:poly-gamma-glutamate synthesis protein (capsule biosynthesis protein)
VKTLTAASLIAASALLAVSCSSDADDSTAQSDTRTKPAKAPSAAKETTPAAVKEPFVIAFGGDVHFEGSLRSRLDSPATALGPIASTLRKADFAMVNLETAITQGGVPAPVKEFHFRAPASAFTALRKAGVDVVTEANNHGMDYMEPGLADTLKAIKKSRFPVVGIGKNADAAYEAYRTTVKGNKIAVVGATQVLDDNLIPAWTATDSQGGLASAKVVPRMLQAVKDARKGSDVVIVYLHWGQEMSTCPLPRQQELANQLIGAGADIVVGSHAHVLLGGGYLKGRYVNYGLGNFVFSSASGQTANSGVLLLKVNGRKVSKAVWKPARISAGLPHLISGSAAAAELKRWNGLRRCTGLS